MKLLREIKDKIQGKAPGGARRASQWPKVRAAHLNKNPTCAVCGGTKKLEVHHIKPFHLYPGLELEESNLETLCESGRGGLNCHLQFGHGGNFKKENPKVKTDAGYWSARLREIK